MSIDVIDIVNDDDLCFPFTLTRYTNTFEQGGSVNVGVSVALYGPVQPYRPAFQHNFDSSEMALMVPEADRIKGLFVFWCQETILHTNPAGPGDIIAWDGQLYKILGVTPWPENGYYRAVGVRQSGQ